MNNPMNVKSLPTAYPGQQPGGQQPVYSTAPPYETDEGAEVVRAASMGTGPAVVAPKGYNAFVPLFISGLALLVFFSFLAAQAYSQRQALLAAHATQQQTVDNAGRLRASLDALAADTQRMADAGNPNAGALVAELRRRGITINAAAATAAAAPTTAAEAAPSGR